MRLAARGIDGLTEYRTVRPDLVIIDATRPTEGFGLFGLLREVDPNVCAVMVGTRDDEALLLQETGEYGILEHLLYPLEIDQLDRAVEATLAERQETIDDEASEVDAGIELDAESEVDALLEPLLETETESGGSSRIWKSEGAKVPATGPLEGYRLADVLHSCALHKTTGVLVLERQGGASEEDLHQGGHACIRTVVTAARDSRRLLAATQDHRRGAAPDVDRGDGPDREAPRRDPGRHGHHAGEGGFSVPDRAHTAQGDQRVRLDRGELQSRRTTPASRGDDGGAHEPARARGAGAAFALRSEAPAERLPGARLHRRRPARTSSLRRRGAGAVEDRRTRSPGARGGQGRGRDRAGHGRAHRAGHGHHICAVCAPGSRSQRPTGGAIDR